MQLMLDDGYQFGLGAFETISLINKKPVFLDWHMERLQKALTFLGIERRLTSNDVLAWLEQAETSALPDPHAVKIMVSQNNCAIVFRSNPYTPEKLAKGFQLAHSKILRNDTSPFVFHKTMNYGDNILEKRRTHDLDIDEVLFCNTKGQICEGSTTNIFFAREGTLYTPLVSCGLLPGVMRRFVLEAMDVQEVILYPEDISSMTECFVTNSLMGIMPVTRLENQRFTDHTIASQLQYQYLHNL